MKERGEMGINFARLDGKYNKVNLRCAEIHLRV